MQTSELWLDLKRSLHEGAGSLLSTTKKEGARGLCAKSLAQRVRIMLLFTVILLALPLTTNAQEPELGIKPNQPESKVPDLENGELLARKLCVGCHLIDRSSDGVAQADIPSFPLVANRPNQSMEALTNWLNAPHAPMPDPHLTRKEVRDLAGYIMSQRTP